MDGWRISKRRYANPPAAAFDGEGSRRRGGRWTPPGKRVAYASSSLALASLEYFVNLDPQDAPSGLVSVHTSIPDGYQMRTREYLVPSRIMARGAVISRFCGSRTHRCSTSIRGCGSDHISIPCIQHPTRRTMKAAEDALL